jgi:predicted alpha/beta-hydrolase family hydrolase
VALEPIEAAGDPPVRGVLHPADGADGLVLTHGAGGTKDGLLLVAVAEAFAARGVSVLRCDLPYRQARARGAPSPAGAARDRAGLRAALSLLRERVSGRLFLGGHSYGGRMASMLLAEDSTLAAVLLLQSYPLHPPGQPDRRRVEHLPRLRTPTAFVHGTADPFGTLDEIETARALVGARTTLLAVGGGHDLGWGRRRGDAGLPDRIAQAVLDVAVVEDAREGGVSGGRRGARG